MDRFFAPIAAALFLGLASWPVTADSGDGSETGDPFASPPGAAQKDVAPPESSDGQSLGSNLLPRKGFPFRKSDDQPNGWFFSERESDGKSRGEIVDEGMNGGPCFKITHEDSTRSSWRLADVEIKPNTRYELAVFMRTENIEAEEGKGATFGIQDLDRFARPLNGTNNWKRQVLEFFSEDQTRITILLSNRADKGTAWFSRLSLRESLEDEEKDEDSEPAPPPVYRRPSFDDPVFSPEGLTLDRDQVLALAEDIATVVVGFSDHPEISNPVFQSHALGIALRLDPRNRLAVIANGQLDQGQKLKPTGEHSDLDKYWNRLDKWARLLHADDTTTDDKALGLYLGDLARRIHPDKGFAGQFALAHPGDLDAAWARIVPPPPPVQPVAPEVAENTTPEPAPEPDEGDVDPERPPVEPIQPSRGTDNERFKIPDRFPLLTASLFVPVQTGGAESRAALRKVTLSFRDYEYHTYWDESGEKKRRIPHSNQGPTELRFDDEWDRLRSSWNDRVYPMLDRRYEGWPKRGVVDVLIPDYGGNSGSNAVLAVAICFEAMARGLTLDPKVAAVGSWGDEEGFRGHSHLPGIVLGYAKDWPEILIVGPGSRADLERVAATGLVTPFLCTQIIEVSTFGEAVAIASGQPSPETKASLEAYRAIMAVRTKMDAGAMAQNRHVIDKLREVAAANPKHLSAALMLKAAENQQPLDFNASSEIVSRLFRSLEQLAENDLEWVSPEEGLKAIEIFSERMREFKPRLDRGLDRHLTRLDDCTRALGEAARLRERKSGTAMNRVENARTQVRAFRQNLDLAMAAGR